MSPANEVITSWKRWVRQRILAHINGVLARNCDKLYRGESVEVTIPEGAHPDIVVEAIAKLDYDGWQVVRLVPGDSRLIVSVAQGSFWRWVRRTFLPDPHP